MGGSQAGSDDTAASQPQIPDGREGLPQNQYGNQVFTSTPGPALDDFERDTLDVIRAERAAAKWRPNPLDLPPGVQADEFPTVPETINRDLDIQPPRKPKYETAAEKGHHPDWTSARRAQQAGFWGPYSSSAAASRDSYADVDEVANSDDEWSQGSEYDGGHPWDPHHDQTYARPKLVPLPRTQWKQRVERKEMNHRQNRAPDAYWDPDKWDSEYKRRGCWVLPHGETLASTKGCEMKMMLPGEREPEGNRYIKPITEENLLYWIDALDRLDPAKRPGREVDWALTNADRNVMSWRDQFNPPDYTETEWKHQYDQDSRDQWEDLQTIHPSDWKTRDQSGNTLPPAQLNDEFSEWKAKYENSKTENSKGKEIPDVGVSPGGDKAGLPGANRVVRVMRLTRDGDSDPPQSTSTGGMSMGAQLGLVGGVVGLIAGAVAIGKWAWERIKKKKEERDAAREAARAATRAATRAAMAAAEAQEEEDKTHVNEDGGSEAARESTVSPGSWPVKKVKRSHPREWFLSVDTE